MKKNIILIFMIFLLTGCRDKYFSCTANIENTDMDYKQESNYKIYYKKNYVTKIKKEDTYISDNEETIKYFKDYKDLELNNLNNLYNGFEYKVELKNKDLKINTIIDLNLTDIKKMVKNKYLNEEYVVNNRLTTTGAIYYYKERGIYCEK